MSRTYRIWQRKPHPERLFFFHTHFPIYFSDKKRFSWQYKSRTIRNRWWRTLRHRNNMLCRKVGMRWKYPHILYDCGPDVEIEIEKMDEYFNSRYRKADYTEYFD